jgi:hypothetical protein
MERSIIPAIIRATGVAVGIRIIVAAVRIVVAGVIVIGIAAIDGGVPASVDIEDAGTAPAMRTQRGGVSPACREATKGSAGYDPCQGGIVAVCAHVSMLTAALGSSHSLVNKSEDYQQGHTHTQYAAHHSCLLT